MTSARSRLVAGAVFIASGFALHLIEPVATVDCVRNVPGPAACTIRRTFFHVLPYQTNTLPAVAALVAEPERSSKADPQAVTCMSLSLMDGEGETTRFACLEDAAAVDRAQRFFADGSRDGSLRLGYGEPLVLAVSAASTLAGVLLCLGAVAGRRRAETLPGRRPSGRERS